MHSKGLTVMSGSNSMQLRRFQAIRLSLSPIMAGRHLPTCFHQPSWRHPSGVYVVIHRLSGVNDLDASDGVLQLFGASPSASRLNNTGDNMTLYRGINTTGAVLDYVAYGSGVVVNGPGTGWSAPEWIGNGQRWSEHQRNLQWRRHEQRQ